MKEFMAELSSYTPESPLHDESFWILVKYCTSYVWIIWSSSSSSSLSSTAWPGNGWSVAISSCPILPQITKLFVKVMLDIGVGLVQLYICDSAAFSAFHDQLASLDSHAQLTRCFSAVAEPLVLVTDIYENFTLMPSNEVSILPRSDLTTRKRYNIIDFNKKVSCCCGSRSYCLRGTVYWQTIRNRFRLQVEDGWYTRSDSTGRVYDYERTQTQSTQAWLTKVYEVSE